MFDGLLILIIFFIIGPIIRGLFEAKTKRKQWEKRTKQNINIPVQPKQYKFTEKEHEVIPRKYSDVNAQDIVKPRLSRDTSTPDRQPITSNTAQTSHYPVEQHPVEQLFTADSFYKAIILKEILDPPKSLQRR
jgi:hypothetical protein